jgi:hypothetical protein
LPFQRMARDMTFSVCVFEDGVPCCEALYFAATRLKLSDCEEPTGRRVETSFAHTGRNVDKADAEGFVVGGQLKGASFGNKGVNSVEISTSPKWDSPSLDA